MSNNQQATVTQQNPWSCHGIAWRYVYTIEVICGVDGRSAIVFGLFPQKGL